MTQPARRISALMSIIALPVIAVLVTLAFVSSPGAPQIEQQDPVRITVEERNPDAVGATEGGNPDGAAGSENPGGTAGSEAEPPEAPPRGEVAPLGKVEFQTEPPAPRVPTQRIRPQEQRPAQRPAPRPPAVDYDDDDDDDYEYDDDDDDDDWDDDDWDDDDD
ncbi:hypothetical protein [Granulicoccus sp. GXG6511]|uniref:hypothetical protein n=1 Tax=Granulicoccus sp. GXG6511 TaxID=3381351 RepID=UPI003D7DB00D